MPERKMNLNSEKAQSAITIIKTLRENGFQSLFAGGCVRDFLIGDIPKDYDIATNATPNEVEALFPKTIPVGKQFGVILVLVDNEPYEVATFRKDGDYEDGRRPNGVIFTSSEEDAKRRDFTVNGLFYDPIEEEVIDYVDGISDLKRKVVRAIGDPDKRFEEDKLRLLRAIRFSGYLGFEIEEKTWKSLKSRVNKLTAVSQERILEEIQKIFSRKGFLEGFELLVDSGFFEIIFLKESEAKSESVIEEKYYQSLKNDLSQLKKPSFQLALAFISLNDGNSKLQGFMERLKVSKKDKNMIQKIISLQTRFIHFQRLSNGEKKFLLGEPYVQESLEVFKILVMNHGIPQEILNLLTEHLEALNGEEMRPDPWVNGEDLKQLGVSPGPEMKETLESMYFMQLGGEVSSKEEALKWLIKNKI